MIANKYIDFVCQRCGKCCKRRGDIALMPMDVFQIAKLKNISCNDVLEKYTELREEGYPARVIRARNPQMTCVFYDKREGCTIYQARPMACFIFPLVPVGSFEKQYSVQQCYSKVKTGEKEQVDEWIKKSSPRYEAEKQLREKFFSLVMEIKLRRTQLDKVKWKQVHDLLYVEYDLEKDMYQQIEDNLQKVREILSK